MGLTLHILRSTSLPPQPVLRLLCLHSEDQVLDSSQYDLTLVVLKLRTQEFRAVGLSVQPRAPEQPCVSEAGSVWPLVFCYCGARKTR